MNLRINNPTHTALLCTLLWKHPTTGKVVRTLFSEDDLALKEPKPPAEWPGTSEEWVAVILKGEYIRAGGGRWDTPDGLPLVGDVMITGNGHAVVYVDSPDGVQGILIEPKDYTGTGEKLSCNVRGLVIDGGLIKQAPVPDEFVIPVQPMTADEPHSISFDNHNTFGSTNGGTFDITTLDLPLTVATGNCAYFGAASYITGGSSATTVFKWNGTAMTAELSSRAPGTYRCQTGYLLAPATGALNFTATYSDSRAAIQLGGVSLAGVNQGGGGAGGATVGQTATNDDSDGSPAPSITLSSLSINNYVVDFLVGQDGTSATAGNKTQQSTHFVGSLAITGMASLLADGTSEIMSWSTGGATLTKYVHDAAEFKVASAAAAGDDTKIHGAQLQGAGGMFR